MDPARKELLKKILRLSGMYGPSVTAGAAYGYFNPELDEFLGYEGKEVSPKGVGHRVAKGLLGAGAGAAMGFLGGKQKDIVKKHIQGLPKMSEEEVVKPSRMRAELTGIAAGTGANVLRQLSTTGISQPPTIDPDQAEAISDKLIKYIQSKKPNLSLKETPVSISSMVVPQLDTLVSNKKDPSIFAHEIGHATGPLMSKNKVLKKALNALYMLGKVGPGIATSHAIMSRDKDKATKGAWLGSAVSVPMVAEEVRASAKAYKVLSKLSKKLTPKQKLRAFGGIPSYMLYAMAPHILIKLKDMMGGYTHTKEV